MCFVRTKAQRESKRTANAHAVDLRPLPWLQSSSHFGGTRCATMAATAAQLAIAATGHSGYSHCGTSLKWTCLCRSSKNLSTYIYIDIYTHSYTLPDVRLFACVCILRYMYKWLPCLDFLCTCIYIYIHIYICIHKCMHVLTRSHWIPFALKRWTKPWGVGLAGLIYTSKTPDQDRNVWLNITGTFQVIFTK